MNGLAWVGVLLLGAAPPTARPELLVFAAASTTETMQELGERYRAQTGTSVVYAFGASNDLARQIIAGAPAAVFVSADEAQMDRVETAGRVDAADRVEVARNSLVFVQPPGVPHLRALSELPTLKTLALADPEAVPAGVYAREVLVAKGLWEAVQPHVIPTQDVRAALAAVTAQRAAGAIVYATDALLAPSLWVAPHSFMPEVRIVYPAAAVRGPNAGAARAFVAYLAGPQGQAVFQSHGFRAAQKRP